MLVYENRIGEVVWIKERQTITGRDHYYVFPVTVTAVQIGRITGTDVNGVPVKADFHHVFVTKEEALSTIPAGLVIDLDPQAIEMSRLNVGKPLVHEFQRLHGDRFVDDDEMIRMELVKRQLWQRFLCARDAVKARPRYCVLATERDVFLGFDGFTNSADNGFVWFRNLEPGVKDTILADCTKIIKAQ